MTVDELVRQRIGRGAMPRTLDALLEQRGTLDNAAADLARFVEAPVDECRRALEAVYAPQH